MKHDQKIICIDDKNQKVLKKGNIYTVDKTLNASEGRVFLKEWKRFSFSKNRFEEVGE